MTDCELVRRMQQGDMQAFDTLYERYKDDAYRLACLITGSRTDGEDLAQEAFVACAQSIGSLRDGAKFRPWLLRTLSRAAWKYCRKARRETPVSEFFDENTGDSALSAVLRTEEQRRLYAALRTQLHLAEMLAVFARKDNRLYFGVGVKHFDFAVIAGYAVHAVQKHLFNLVVCGRYCNPVKFWIFL